MSAMAYSRGGGRKGGATRENARNRQDFPVQRRGARVHYERVKGLTLVEAPRDYPRPDQTHPWSVVRRGDLSDEPRRIRASHGKKGLFNPP